MAFQTGLEDKPWYYGAVAGLVVAILAVAGVQYLFINDMNEEIRSAERELDDLQKRIEAGRAAEKSLPQFREEVARLELELEKLRRILPSSRNTEEIIKKVKSLVDQGDFVMRRLVFPDLTASPQSEVYKEWNISVSLQGGYHDLAILFNRLSNFSRIVNIEQFTITALGAQARHTISCDFVAKTFVYVEPVAAAPAAGTPGGSS